ncbi:MFS transporter [Candidatus Peregrinibacteria bacterium]|nr:MFS transporter [Candidatus Peregrinibacteria bacterium]
MKKTLLLNLHLHPSPLWVIFEVNFLRNFAVALLTAVFPLYLKQFTGSDAGVSMIFIIGYAAALISKFYSSWIIEHFKKRKALIFALTAFTVLFAAFATVSHVAIILPLFAIYQFILALFIFDVSLYIKHYSNFKTIAENEGKLGSLSNIGWIVGPLLGSIIASRFGFQAAFLASAFVSLVALFIFFFVRLSHEEIHFTHNKSFAANLKFFFKDPNLRKTYFNNAGLGFIYSIWDMLPLLMLKLNATLPIIGLTKTLMGVPQSVFEYPVGIMADKETGERKIFIIGYLLSALFTMLLGFTFDLKLFIIFFFIAATGTSFLEMTRDSYFYRQVPEKEVELISVYRTSDILPYFIGQILAFLSLSVLPIELWFIIGGSAAMFFTVNAYWLKDLRK